jgi:hypothetical protein
VVGELNITSYIVYMYENSIIKPTKNCRKERGGRRRIKKE